MRARCSDLHYARVRSFTNDPEQAAEAAKWLRYARDDLAAARELFDDALQGRVSFRNACYLSQQAGEKAMKSIFVALGIDPPRIHNLNALREALPSGWAVRTVFPNLSALTVWAVEARYPADLPEATRADAEAAIAMASGVVDTVADDFGRHGLAAE